ncbi:DUF4228 domain-containing protein [Cephalotus follicularis]|uniref:DUF4228 domain-containing protein n=1 Tax=Cephalotus follicularis TaxID=3775 RepID=A0A1Q3CYV8_CEPFO|nr:DUF4228 domain-containing protein [Cephalotus follicularis]
MGNSLGGKKTTKIMKITGETFKLKTPVKAGDVLKDYPNYFLLESEAVKHYGIRAKPLQAHQNLEPKRLYFLVELPDVPKEKTPRRVRSGINMSAKDRLESLMLSRRSVSDLSIMRPISTMEKEGGEGGDNGSMRVKMRLPKIEVERLMKESLNEAEAAERIVDLYVENSKSAQVGKEGMLLQQQVHWKDGHGSVGGGLKVPEKRVSFLPINEGGSQIAVA